MSLSYRVRGTRKPRPSRARPSINGLFGRDERTRSPDLKDPFDPGRSSRSLDGIETAVQCDLDGANCTIDRRWFEDLMANPAKLAKQARVIPSIRDGENRGFKFYGIRPRTLLHALGVKNGDLLVSVNGEPLGALEQALDLFSKLRGQDRFEFRFERKGRDVEIVVELTGPTSP